VERRRAKNAVSNESLELLPINSKDEKSDLREPLIPASDKEISM